MSDNTVYIDKNTNINGYYPTTNFSISTEKFNELSSILEESNERIILCKSSLKLADKMLETGLAMDITNCTKYSFYQLGKIKNQQSFISMIAFSKQKQTIQQIYESILSDEVYYESISINGIIREEAELFTHNQIKLMTSVVSLESCRIFFQEQVIASRLNDNKLTKIRKHMYMYSSKKYFTNAIIKNKYFNLPIKVKVRVYAKFSNLFKK